MLERRRILVVIVFFQSARKKKGLDCSYVLSGCYFDDIQVIFDDDDGNQD